VKKGIALLKRVGDDQNSDSKAKSPVKRGSAKYRIKKAPPTGRPKKNGKKKEEKRRERCSKKKSLHSARGKKQIKFSYWAEIRCPTKKKIWGKRPRMSSFLELKWTRTGGAGLGDTPPSAGGFLCVQRGFWAGASK